jgi:microsomal dipeptidase-like Zn-dependent dipeptidase
VAELKAEKAALRKKYRYMARENDKKIEAITAKQEAERDMQKKLLKRYEDFLKLINFVKYIEEDSFWRAEIVQIVASTMSSGDLRLELIPRSGNHTVSFGTVDDVEEKLDKLLTFYENGLRNIGWDNFRRISVEYKGQVVCTK